MTKMWTCKGWRMGANWRKLAGIWTVVRETFVVLL